MIVAGKAVVGCRHLGRQSARSDVMCRPPR